MTNQTSTIKERVMEAYHFRHATMPAPIVTEVSGHYKRFQEQKQILDNERTLFDWASKQTYIALGNMLTAAALLGIDSTPMEGFNQEKLDALLEEEGLLENDQFGASVLATFGYRKEEPKRGKARRNMEEVAQWV